MGKIATFFFIVVMAITIIGAISTGDGAFVTSGIISIIPLARTIKKFVNDNSGGYES
jgi:hypothetical protein